MKESDFMQVFISHTRGDREIALAVTKELQERNINVWSDTHLPVGSDWREELEKALNLSDAIIAILNKNSYSSSSVRTELEHALFNDKFKGKFLPVLISKDQDDLLRLPWVLSKIFHLRLSPDESPSRLGSKIVNAFMNYLDRE